MKFRLWTRVAPARGLPTFACISGEAHEIQRVGSDEPIAVDTRIVAATNRNLRRMSEELHSDRSPEVVADVLREVINGHGSAEPPEEDQDKI